MTVAQKARLGGQMAANLRKRFIAPGRSDAVRFAIEGLLQFQPAAFPFGDLHTGPEFWLDLIERVGKEAWQERGAAGALDELSRTREQPEHQTHQRRTRQIAGGEVNEQARSGGQRRALPTGFALRRGEMIEPFGMADFLL